MAQYKLIELDDGTSFMARLSVDSATEDPLTIEEIVIIKLLDQVEQLEDEKGELIRKNQTVQVNKTEYLKAMKVIEEYAKSEYNGVEFVDCQSVKEFDMRTMESIRTGPRPTEYIESIIKKGIGSEIFDHVSFPIEKTMAGINEQYRTRFQIITERTGSVGEFRFLQDQKKEESPRESHPLGDE